MGSGASILCGGRRRLRVQCVDIRMIWCNGLIVNANNEIETTDNDENLSDNDLEAIDSDEVTIDYDYEAELSAFVIERIATEWERN